MNFLAHQYLSFNSKHISVGNFIADTIKGTVSDELPIGVQLGVKIHRAIDEYTDTHPLVLETRKLLYPFFGKYAAVVQDIYYDHFLAIHWSDYHKESLAKFVQGVYKTLNEEKDLMNAQAQRILYYMELHDWLTGYARIEGIDRALKGLSTRTAFESHMENGIPPLLHHFKTLDGHFLEFFPQLEENITSTFLEEIKALV